MDMLYTVSIVLLMLLASSSHAGICVGIPVGTGLLNRRKAIVIYVVAALLGATIQGNSMLRAVVAPSTCVVLTSASISVVPSVLGIPLSINFALYTSQIGCTLTRSSNGSLIPTLLSVVALWIATTAMIAIATYAVEKLIIREVISRYRSPRKLLAWMRIVITALGALMSFVVGANTFGYLLMFTRGELHLWLLLYAVFIIGAGIFSTRSIERMAYQFYRIRLSQAISSLLVSIISIELATWRALPLSASLVISTALYAAGYASTFRVLSTKNFLSYVTTQFLSIPIALALGAVISLVT